MTEMKIETREELKHHLQNIGMSPAGTYILRISEAAKKEIKNAYEVIR